MAKKTVSDITKSAAKGYIWLHGASLYNRLYYGDKPNSQTQPTQEQQNHINHEATAKRIAKIEEAQKRRQEYIARIAKAEMCANCAAETTPDDKFCPECGCLLFTECEKCSAKIRPNDNFCTKCGMSVDDMTIELPTPLTNETIEARKKMITESISIPVTPSPSPLNYTQKNTKSDKGVIIGITVVLGLFAAGFIWVYNAIFG